MKTLDLAPARTAPPQLSIICALWGHSVDNRAFRQGCPGCIRCGAAVLTADRRGIRIGHTLSCFLRHHTYERVGSRDGHNEYACVYCGHPLLFRVDQDPYVEKAGFTKRVRYLCGLLGHRVHEVARRSGGVEYACGCGHSFVQRRNGERRITHPLKCFFLGHWVHRIESRGRYGEYACRTCGHPFLFADPGAGR
jgi:hypothetical protein